MAAIFENSRFRAILKFRNFKHPNQFQNVKEHMNRYQDCENRPLLHF